MIDQHTLLLVAVIAVVTVMLRFAPFLLLRGGETPKFVTYLGKVLPYAVMGMLVVFCFKDISVMQSPHGLPELIACAVVAVLYIWRRNTLLSIVCGTGCYMLLIQVVFK